MTYKLDDFLTAVNITSSEASSFPFLSGSTPHVLRNDKTLGEFTPGTFGNDFYEGGIPHADKWLSDLTGFIMPSSQPSLYYNSAWSARFVRNIGVGEMVVVVNGSQCMDPYSVCAGETAPAPLP
eukprot:5346446-Prymnesium_polylepis.1